MLQDVVAWLGITDPRYVPNTITGFFSFASVVLTGCAAIAAWIIKQNLLRREKRNDLRAALRAEIEVQWRMLKGGPNAEETIPLIKAKLEGPDGSSYSPHFSRYPSPEVFGSVKAEITALGREEIPPVVQFYHQLAVMDNFVTELQSKDFMSYSQERKFLMIKDMFAMVDQAVVMAENALTILEELLDVPTSERLRALKFRLDKKNRPNRSAPPT